MKISSFILLCLIFICGKAFGQNATGAYNGPPEISVPLSQFSQTYSAHPDQTVCVPESLAIQIEATCNQEFAEALANRAADAETLRVGYGNLLVNCIVRDQFQWMDGIYYSRGMGPHFLPTLVVYDNTKLYVFRHIGQYGCYLMIKDFCECIDSSHLSEKKVISYAKVICDFLFDQKEIVENSGILFKQYSPAKVYSDILRNEQVRDLKYSLQQKSNVFQMLQALLTGLKECGEDEDRALYLCRLFFDEFVRKYSIELHEIFDMNCSLLTPSEKLISGEWIFQSQYMVYKHKGLKELFRLNEKDMFYAKLELSKDKSKVYMIAQGTKDRVLLSVKSLKAFHGTFYLELINQKNKNLYLFTKSIANEGLLNDEKYEKIYSVIRSIQFCNIKLLFTDHQDCDHYLCKP